MIAIATLAFFLIVLAWLVAPNGAPAETVSPDPVAGVAPADATA